MKIGEVIRKYRKELNMTQEEMAIRLGVTTPAVNKWENGNTCPDVLMLAPIARLLRINLDTLLSFREELTEAEIGALVKELDSLFKDNTYEEVFHWAKNKIEEYPNCENLIWQFAVILNAQRMMKEVPENPKYDKFILKCYERVLESTDEKMKYYAADSLFSYYLRIEDYEKAESYLKYFSEQNPERKRKQAEISNRTGRTEEAYKAYEEILFSGYQMLSMVFNSLLLMNLAEGKLEKAHYIAGKQEKLAQIFEMGKYNEISCQLELAVKEGDREKAEKIMDLLIENVETVVDFTKADLYEHMTFKEVDSEFIKELRKQLEQRGDLFEVDDVSR